MEKHSKTFIKDFTSGPVLPTLLTFSLPLFPVIGLSALLGLGFGLGCHGFWAGSTAAGFVPFLLGIIFYLSGRWKNSASLSTK